MIKLLLVDADGVLTDGVYNTSERGVIFKSFFSRDFHGMSMLNEMGIKIAVITTATDNVILHQCRRAAPYALVHKGEKDKVKCVDTFYGSKYDWSEMAFMGDDTIDIPLLRRVGLPGCPGDADPQVIEFIEEADDGFVSSFSGGRGAVREFSDYIRIGETNEQKSI